MPKPLFNFTAEIKGTDIKSGKSSELIPTPNFLVKKVEGPFDKGNKLMEEVVEGNTYVFKATEFEKSTNLHKLYNYVNWAYEIDGNGKPIPLNVQNFYDKNNNTVYINYKYYPKEADKDKNSIRIYAYVNSSSKDVSVEVPVVRFPFIIARSVKRAGVCYGTNGVNFTREDIKNLNVSYPKEKLKLRQYLENGFDDIGDDVDAKDKNSRVKYAMDYIEEYNDNTDDELFDIFRNDLDDWALGDLDDNLHDMVDFFKRNSKTSNKYEDRRLTNAIANHEKTKQFIEGFSPLLKKALDNNVHLLNNLKVKDTKSQFVKTQYDKGVGGNPSVLGIEGLQDLNSLKYDDKFSGLGISVDGTQAYNISLIEFTLEDSSYQGKFKLEIFDHFGLDSADILKDTIRKHEEFICWFMLQHLRGFKPFITYIPLTYNFSGSLNNAPLKIKRDEGN